MTPSKPLTYADVGVARGEDVLAGLLCWVRRTRAHRAGRAGDELLPNGYFASVLRLTDDLALAICTDGVGSKILIAEQLGRYDTIGIDCIAMNVNDLLCVGAEPLAMVDYIACNVADADVLEQIGRGLHEGARQAAISIPGGELAQLPEIITGPGGGPSIDLVGTCVGIVHPERINDGSRVAPGDAVIGLASSGIHSNGLTLARRALFGSGEHHLADPLTDTGETLGDALLTPTRIYAAAARALLASGIDIHALANITGEGFFNLTRVAAPVSFVLDDLPEPPPIFHAIQDAGPVSDAEMHLVFNMGVGFCIVVPEADANRTLELLADVGESARVIGRVVEGEERTVALPQRGLLGRDGEFVPSS